jgi:hypothetical protein
MRMTIRGHFDGRVIVPDEPVGDLPVNTPLSVEVLPLSEQSPPYSEQAAREAYARLMARVVDGANIPDEALRRENLYEDR